MTDPTEPTEPGHETPDPEAPGPDDRAEQALRDALAGRADAFEPRELRVPTPVRRRRGWLPAAAAVVVLVGGVTAIGITAGGNGGGGSADSSAASDSSAAREGAAASPRSTVGGNAASPGVAPKDDTGPEDRLMRWVSRYDVEVQVPSTWVYAAPPARPDCIRKPGDTWDDAPRKPYVAIDVSRRAVPAIGCEPHSSAPAAFGDLPFELWQPTISFSQGGPTADLAADGTWTYRGWTLRRWTVPGTAPDQPVQVSLLTGPGQDDLAARIHDSARSFTIDQNGCPATSAVQDEQLARPPAVTSASRLTPSSVSVCQYQRGVDTPGLLGSRRLTGSQMGELLQGIAQAPAGSGPNAPSTCDPVPGDTAIELRFNRGDDGEPATAYVYYDSCVDNGIYDADSVKQLTAADCRPLFAEPPIMLWESSSSLDGVCRE